MKIFEKLIQLNETKRKWVSVTITVCIAGILSLWGIYGIGEYGIALFMLTPFLIGFSSTLIYGYKNKITKSEVIWIGFTTLTICTLALIVFAIEGLICIVMVAPIGILFTWIGSLIGYSLLQRSKKHYSICFINSYRNNTYNFFCRK